MHKTVNYMHYITTRIIYSKENQTKNPVNYASKDIFLKQFTKTFFTWSYFRIIILMLPLLNADHNAEAGLCFRAQFIKLRPIIVSYRLLCRLFQGWVKDSWQCRSLVTVLCCWWIEITIFVAKMWGGKWRYRLLTYICLPKSVNFQHWLRQYHSRFIFRAINGGVC